jgi:hypothetical protein
MQGNDRFLTLRQASSSALTSSSPSANCDPRIAARLAAKLFGCYRASDANDPETFLAAATAMLAQYPEAAVAKVCDPVRGLPSTSKFLPSITEIREACEREMVWHYAVEKRERERRHTAEVLAPSPPATAESRQRVRALANQVLAELSVGDAPQSIGFRPPRSPAEAEASRRYFEGRLEALKADYAARPPSLSPALRPAPPDEDVAL